MTKYGFMKRMSLSSLILELILVPGPAIFWMMGATFLCVLILATAPLFYLVGGLRSIQKFAMNLADYYWSWMVRSVEKWGRYKFIFSGDKIPLRENALIMANHRWYLDWLIIFSLSIRKGRLGCSKFFAKDSIKYIPGIGWGIALLGHIFLKRNWTDDLATIEATFNSLKTLGLPFWLISHLEGTRMDPGKLKKSQEFAKKKDLPVLNNLLLPRTKGFVATIQALRTSNLADAVYDVTLIYNKGESYPTVASIVLRQGGQVNMHVRRYKLSDIPKGDDELAQWINDRWKEKDDLIEYFNKNGHFPQEQNEPFRYVPMLLS